MSNPSRRAFLKTAGQGTLAAGLYFGLPQGAWVEAAEAQEPASNVPAKETRLECDVLVIGGGFAGLFAAIKARENGASVILVDKGFVGKSGLSPFSSSFIAFNPEWGYDLDKWMAFLHRISEYVDNKYWMQRALKDSWSIYQDLVSWGVEFRKDKDGKLIREPVTPGVTEQILYAHSARNAGPSDKNHVQMCRKQALKVGVKIVDKMMVPELLRQNGRIIGAIGIPVDSFNPHIFLAKTTILCVGPCSFKPLGYPPLVSTTGDGDGMAYRAGAEILGKEYCATDYTSAEAPSIIARRGLPEDVDRFLGLPKIPSGGLFLKCADGQGEVIPGFFDRPKGVTEYKFAYVDSDSFINSGRGPMYWVSPDGNKPLTGGACLGNAIRKGDGLWPADHDCHSSLPGLYAAGDCLGTMQNGAVYNLRGASTLGCMVTGAIAGSNAGKEAAAMDKPIVGEEEIARAMQFVHAPKERKGGYSPRWVTQLLKNTMAPYFVSYIKKADRLQATLTIVEFMQEHLIPGLIARDPHELRLAHETRNMVLTAEMQLRSALFRTESRGNHYREDYPRRDDTDWLAWTKIKQEQGKMTLVKVPIPKEWRPDPSTPYRERYPMPMPGDDKA
jgi:succinate dehydrogenase/fumarate reductase flavoprotein subunit